MNRLASRAVVALFVPLAACTGATLGEKNPGADTYLEYGAIAVDDRSDTCFTPL